MSPLRFLSAFALAAAIVAPMGAVAQTVPVAGAPARHAHHPNRFIQAVRSLSLTPDQRRQIDDAVAANHNASKGADKATKHENRRRLRGQIEGMLTPDQRAQLRAQLRAPH